MARNIIYFLIFHVVILISPVSIILSQSAASELYSYPSSLAGLTDKLLGSLKSGNETIGIQLLPSEKFIRGYFTEAADNSVGNEELLLKRSGFIAEAKYSHSTFTDIRGSFEFNYRMLLKELYTWRNIELKNINLGIQVKKEGLNTFDPESKFYQNTQIVFLKDKHKYILEVDVAIIKGRWVLYGLVGKLDEITGSEDTTIYAQKEQWTNLVRDIFQDIKFNRLDTFLQRMPGRGPIRVVLQNALVLNNDIHVRNKIVRAMKNIPNVQRQLKEILTENFLEVRKQNIFWKSSEIIKIVPGLVKENGLLKVSDSQGELLKHIVVIYNINSVMKHYLRIQLTYFDGRWFLSSLGEGAPLKENEDPPTLELLEALDLFGNEANPFNMVIRKGKK